MGISVLHESNHSWPFNPEKSIQYIANNPDLFEHYQGIIGWKWALLTPAYAETFSLQFHLVRSPVKAIQSALTHTDRLFKQVERYIGKPDFIPSHYNKKQIKLGRAINYWIRYNNFIAKNKTLLQVESFTPYGRSFLDFCELTHLSAKPGQLFSDLPKNINTRKKRFQLPQFKRNRQTLCWKHIQRDYPSKIDIILEMANRYGYESSHFVDGIA